MSWDELENVAPPEASDRLLALQRAVARALDVAPELRDYLEKVVDASCYTRGATIEEITYREGQRYMARSILQLGGCLND